MLLLLALPVYAQDGSMLKLGPSLNGNTLVSAKFFSLGYQSTFVSVFDYQYEGGFFIDNQGEGRKSAAFANAALGLSIIKETLYTRFFFGPALISDTDTRLSTHYQFNTDAEIGIRDERDVAMGIGYKHMSNAGIKLPNAGRDFIFIKLAIPY